MWKEHNSDCSVTNKASWLTKKPQGFPLEFSPHQEQSRRALIRLKLRNQPVQNHCIGACVEAKGELDLERLQHALDLVALKHPILRLGFSLTDEANGPELRSPSQSNLISFNGQASQEDLLRPRRLYEIAKNLTYADLEAGIPFRVTVFRSSDSLFYLIFDFCHIVFDGWSFGIFVQELIHAYADHDSFRTSIKSGNFDYFDFSYSINKELRSTNFRPHVESIKSRISNSLMKHSDQFVTQRPSNGETAGHSGYSFSQLATDSARVFSSRMRHSLFITLLTTFKIVYDEAFDDEMRACSFAMAGRPYSRLQHVIGKFNSAGVIYWEQGKAIGDLDDYEFVRNEVNGNLRDQIVPIYAVTGLPGFLSPKFDLTMHNYPVSIEKAAGISLMVADLFLGEGQSKLLSVAALPLSANLRVEIAHKEPEYDANSVEELLDRWNFLLEALESQ